MSDALDAMLAQQAGGGGMSGDPLDRMLSAQAVAGPQPAFAADDGMNLSPFGIDTGIKMPVGISNFLAGAGKGITDTARGIGQMVGAVDRGDIAESRRLDKPLTSTGAGLAGDIAGNLAATLPTAFIPGVNTLRGAALVNGLVGLAQPSASTGETAANTGIAALAGPLALSAGRAVAAGYQGVKSLAAPFFESGQRAIAADVLQRAATDPTAAAAAMSNASSLVPGSNPTAAQVSLDPGLSQLERTLRGIPETAKLFAVNDAAQKAARLNAVQDIAGRGSHYDDIVAGRQLFANQDYANAISQGVDQNMATALAPQIQNLMERPSIIAAQKDAIRLAKESGTNLSDFGSVEGLDWLKKALDNQISKAAQPGSAIGTADLRALMQTKGDLMSTLEQIAPAYKQANQNYAAMSKQVNGLDVARSVLDKLQRPGSEYMPNGGPEMAVAYQRALSEAQDSVKKATGMNQSIGDVMPTSDIAALESVARDLGRKATVETAGAARGSPTAQNLASQNMLHRVLGPTGMPQSWAQATLLQTLMRPVQWAASAGEPRIQGILSEAMLDPAMARGLLVSGQSPQPMSMLGQAAQPYLPALGLLGAAPYRAQQN